MLFYSIICVLIEDVLPQCLLRNVWLKKWVADSALKLVILFDSKTARGSYVSLSILSFRSISTASVLNRYFSRSLK